MVSGEANGHISRSFCYSYSIAIIHGEVKIIKKKRPPVTIMEGVTAYSPQKSFNYFFFIVA